MRVRLLIACASLLCTSCTFDVRGLDDDVDGGVPDGGGTCDPAGAQNSCSADGTKLSSCRPDGSGLVTTTCPFACAGSGATAHCAQLVPASAGLPSDLTQPGLQHVSVSGTVTFNTDTGGVSGGGVNRPDGKSGQVVNGIFYRAATQANGAPGVGVFAFAGLNLPAGSIMTFTGSSAALFVSTADVTLSGQVNLVGDCASAGAGPGGFIGGRPGAMVNGHGAGPGGGAPGAASGSLQFGGGGGGFGDHGGSGGMGNGGIMYGELTATPIILYGGSGGGAGNNDDASHGGGGGGGGALQISVAGSLTLNGTITAGGCGGGGGSNNGGGGGGGAGGEIILEAVHVTLGSGAVLAVNGGGGGGGDDGGHGGDLGPASQVVASGGAATSNNGTNGGNGGAALGTLFGVDADPAMVSGHHESGGGGGAVGRIAIRTLDGNGLTDVGAIFSPDPSMSNSAMEKPAVLGAAVFQ